MIAGFLFEINGYIPMIICVATLIISARIACNFKVIDNEENESEKNKEKIKVKQIYKNNLRDIKTAFSFIFNSKRLRALMVYSAVMYGIIMVMNTYEMNLLDDINISASTIGIIYAIMQIVAGISSKKQNKFHNKYKNKTLTVIGLTYTIACLIAGIVSIMNISNIVIISIVIATYTIRYIGTGLYYVLIKKYITNFTNSEVANKVYAAYGLVTGMGNAIICIFGAIVVLRYNIRYSMVIFGIVFLTIMIIIVNYMKNRVGLEPTEYRKKDINYKEYIGLK